MTKIPPLNVKTCYTIVACRWEVLGDDDGIQYEPFPVPKQGLPIKLVPISNQY